MSIKRKWRPKGRAVSALDLFCGMGGQTHGMVEAGAKVVLSVDAWAVAVHLHKANHPDVPCMERRLGEDAKEDLALIVEYLRPERAAGRHIHVHGSPPCQAFSSLGKKQAKDGYALVNHFLWLVARLKEMDLCDSWSMENVPLARGHFPELPHHMMMASDYGAPQDRLRWVAGEGWTPEVVEGGTSWNEALNDPTIPKGSVLNTVGASWSNSHRARASDSPWNAPSRTLTRQKPSIRKENPDGTFTKVRKLSAEEMTVLFGFPWGLDLSSPTNQYDLFIAIGNCMCPQVGTAIIRGIHRPS